MNIKIKNPFSKKRVDHNNENVIEQDTSSGSLLMSEQTAEPLEHSTSDNKDRQPKRSFFKRKAKPASVKPDKKSKEQSEEFVKSRSTLEKIAFSLFSKRVSNLEEFRQTYDQSGIPVVFEAYVSTGFLISLIAAVPVFAVSLLLEVKLLPRAPLFVPVIGSAILYGVAFGIAIAVWLMRPAMMRRGFKSKLENQLAYSFGILGVLAAAGMNLERLFERIAASDSNPVLADLAKRFLRNIRVFGLDTQAALAEVAEHSPSEAFSKMLESIAVAQKTTGSIHDLVMFESSRLLQEKRDKLRKTIGSLAVTAELYITLVVVGPIIFIVMLAIFTLLPVGGKLPSPILFINLIVFIGVPVLSVMFVLMLDSVVSKA
jgi:hypothetical protein